MKLLALLITLFLLYQTNASGQIQLTGKMVDEKGTALAGVNIILRGTYEGTTSNTKGDFNLLISENETIHLDFRMMGFKSISKKINGTKVPIALGEIRLIEQITEMNSVTISAGAMESSDASRAVILKPLDIVTTPSAMGDIVSALQTLPGTSTVGNDGRLFVRGGDASEVGIYIDGLRVGNAYGTTANNVPTRTRFNPNLFKGTFFSTGGYSAEYGQALSSTLSLNTKDVSARTQGDLNLMSVGGGYSQTLATDKHSISFSGNYFNLNPYQNLVKQDFDWEKSPVGLDLEIAAQQKLKKGGIVKILARTEANKMQLWQPQPGEDSRGDLINLRNTYSYVQSNWKKAFHNGWTLFAGAALSHNLDNFEISGISIDKSSDLIHLKTTAIKDFSDHISMKSGFETYFHTYTEINLNLDKFRNFTEKETYFFSEWDWYLNKRLMIRGGARIGNSKLINDTWIDPRISMAYQVSTNSQISLAAGNFHQLPVDNFRILSNFLKNSEAKHLILNYLYSNDGRTFRAETFIKQYDKLVKFDGEQLSPKMLSNDGAGSAKGFDLFFRDQKTFKNTDYWISYGYVKSERSYNQYRTEVQPDYAPKQNFSVVLKHFVQPLKSQIGASVSMNDGYPYTDPNKDGEMNSKTNPYQSVSVSWSYLPKPNLIIHFAVNNVLGRENVFGYSFAKNPEENGFYPSLPKVQGAPRFLFLGVFLTLSKDKNANFLNNL